MNGGHLPNRVSKKQKQEANKRLGKLENDVKGYER